MTQNTDLTQELHARALAALGHPARLSIFRLLVRAGRGGMIVGEIGTHLDIPPSTLAHHLNALKQAGLVTQIRQGREVLTLADFAAMRRTLDYLTDECCIGVEPRSMIV